MATKKKKYYEIRLNKEIIDNPYSLEKKYKPGHVVTKCRSKASLDRYLSDKTLTIECHGHGVYTYCDRDDVDVFEVTENITTSVSEKQIYFDKPEQLYWGREDNFGTMYEKCKKLIGKRLKSNNTTEVWTVKSISPIFKVMVSATMREMWREGQKKIYFAKSWRPFWSFDMELFYINEQGHTVTSLYGFIAARTGDKNLKKDSKYVTVIPQCNIVKYNSYWLK